MPSLDGINVPCWVSRDSNTPKNQSTCSSETDQPVPSARPVRTVQSFCTASNIRVCIRIAETDTFKAFEIKNIKVCGPIAEDYLAGRNQNRLPDMNLTTISSAVPAYQPQVQSAFQQRAQDFKALQTALDSGDLSAAQQAFTALQQDRPNAAQNTQSSTNSAPTQPNQLGKDLQSLQSALQSGDIDSAQSAFATLKQDLKSVGGLHHAHGHHGHHHSPARGPNGTSSPETGSSPASTANSGTSIGTLLNTQG